MTEETAKNLLVHICPRTAWQAAQAAGEYRPASLAEVGFIHFSRPEQAPGVIQRFYRGQTGLVLLWVDVTRLRAELRWEAADGEIFPHLYGPLNLDAVTEVAALQIDQ